MKTAIDALTAWDNGEIVNTIEMGGLGPGYEQAIHVAVFEIIRDCHDMEFPEEGDTEGWRKASSDIDKRMYKNKVIDDLGLSGAQAGAAKQVAVRAICLGWDEMAKTIPDDRKIMVSKHWPNTAD
jgi:hypothetical protein